MNKANFSNIDKTIIGLGKEDGKTPEEVYNTLKEINHYKQNISEIIQNSEYLSLIILTAYIVKEFKSQTIGFLNLIQNVMVIEDMKPGWKYKTEVVEYEKKHGGKLTEEFRYYIKTNEKKDKFTKKSKYGNKEINDVIFESKDYIFIATSESKKTLGYKIYYNFPAIKPLKKIRI